LPALHARIANHLEHESWGYWHLQSDVLRRRELPDGTGLRAPSAELR
jgi:hypothetical protein